MAVRETREAGWSLREGSVGGRGRFERVNRRYLALVAEHCTPVFRVSWDDERVEAVIMQDNGDVHLVMGPTTRVVLESGELKDSKSGGDIMGRLRVHQSVALDVNQVSG